MSLVITNNNTLLNATQEKNPIVIGVGTRDAGSLAIVVQEVEADAAAASASAASAAASAATASAIVGSGNGLFPNGTVSLPSISFASDTNTGIFRPAADTLAFVEGGAEAMRITNAGNVGIGTTTPATTLDVNGDVTITDKIVHSGDTNTAIRFPAADTVTVETSGAERLRIDSAGRVGLGVTNPNLRFQVAALSSSSSTVIAATETNYLADFRSSQLVYNPVDTTGTTLGFSNSNLGALAFFNTTNAVIGTNGATPLAFVTTNVERMRITGAGNVGIGTSSPAVPLEIGGQATLSLRLLTTTNAVDFRIQTIGASASAVLNTVSNHPLVIFTNNTERMRITAAGNVGIGTNSPSTRLHVAGDTTFGGAIDETVFALTGTTPALDPSNGTIQTWTLSANSSPTDSLSDGESLTLMIDDGTARTITWPSVTWKTNGGVAPTLNTTGFTVIVLWKVSTTLYGARVGDA